VPLPIARFAVASESPISSTNARQEDQPCLVDEREQEGDLAERDGD